MDKFPPPYRVDDRSILLPHYKGLLVDPVLPVLPARLSPNRITHAGHLLCLAAMIVLYPAPRGWRLAVSALLLHAYLWCDNADGAHARRTGQASTAGEYLDHGLDLVNCVYIGVASASAIALAGDTKGLAIATIIPCAAAITCWEQCTTGVFRLGLLNQIESMVFLTAVMVVDSVFGVDDLMRLVVLGFSVQSWIWFFVFSSVAFGIARSVIRVAAANKSVAPALGLFGLLGAGWFAHHSGAIDTVVAYAFASVGIVGFGVRMLRTRICGETPSGRLAWASGLAALAVVGAARLSVANPLAVALTALGGASAIMNTLVVARHASPTSANQDAE